MVNAHKRFLGSVLNAPLPRTLLDDFVGKLSKYLEDNADDFGCSYLRKELMSKYCELDKSSAELRRRRAIDKWLATEKRNAETNIRLYGRSMRFGSKFTSDDVITIARSYIESLIGPTPPIPSGGSFTSGASVSLGRQPGVQSLKYTQGHSATPDAEKHFRAVFDSSIWGSHTPYHCEMVRGNTLFTVPKNAEIDRCAAKEPDHNMYLQKEVGGWIRNALKCVGIDLTDQSKNRSLAEKGSREGNLATLDLSSASDSITTSVVYLLLPVDWVCYMDDIRSKETLVDDEWHTNEMFSSMGNAFTFELETLIFWALVSAVKRLTHTKGIVSVYGDDIILPSSVARIVTRVFGFFGFIINPKKSYWEGGFRESCGGHYYFGCDITPFYVRGPLTSMRRVIHLANSFRKWCNRRSIVGVLDPELYAIWLVLARVVPVALRGGHDYDRTDILVCPGRLPSHRLKERKLDSRGAGVIRITSADSFQVGAYLRWLDEAERDPFRGDALITSAVDVDLPQDTFTRVNKARFVALSLIHI